jgi:hypothetical protein
MILKRNGMRRTIEIDYEIKAESNAFIGNITIQFKFLPSPRYEIKLTLDSGETFNYQFLRPISTPHNNI